MFLIPKFFILSTAGVSALAVTGSYCVPQFLSSDESLRVGANPTAVNGTARGKAAYDCFTQSTQQNGLMKCVFNAIKNDKKAA